MSAFPTQPWDLGANDGEAYLSLEEVAQRLGISSSILVRRVEAGDIPARRLVDDSGTRYELLLSDLGMDADDLGDSAPEVRPRFVPPPPAVPPPAPDSRPVFTAPPAAPPQTGPPPTLPPPALAEPAPPRPVRRMVSGLDLGMTDDASPRPFSAGWASTPTERWAAPEPSPAPPAAPGVGLSPPAPMSPAAAAALSASATAPAPAPPAADPSPPGPAPAEDSLLPPAPSPASVPVLDVIDMIDPVAVEHPNGGEPAVPAPAPELEPPASWGTPPHPPEPESPRVSVVSLSSGADPAGIAAGVIDPRELVTRLLDRWENSLQERIHVEQQQRFLAELRAGQSQIRELQTELQAVRATHAAALADRDRALMDRDHVLAERERALADRERELAALREASSRRRRGLFRR